MGILGGLFYRAVSFSGKFLHLVERTGRMGNILVGKTGRITVIHPNDEEDFSKIKLITYIKHLILQTIVNM